MADPDLQRTAIRHGLMLRTMIHAFRVLRRIVLWGALSLLCLFLIALAINARDERLSPEAQALLQLPENRYKPEENIYVALAGFDAPTGQSVVTVGLAKIAYYNDHFDAMIQDPLAGLTLRATDPSALKFKGKIDFGMPREPPFWAAVRANGSTVDQLVEQNRELYERYLALHDLSGYFETEQASALADVVAPPTEVRNLFLAKFSLVMQTGDAAQKQSALKSLRQDISLWRRMLTGEGNLISKMLAIAYLQNDYLVLSDMIADPSTPIPESVDPLLQDSDLSQWNIGNVFASEFRFHSFVYRQAQAVSANGWQPPDSSDSIVWRWFNRVVLNPVGAQFFKFNATENLDAKLMNQLAGFAEIDPATFTAQRARYRNWENESADFVRLRTVYNPIGKILVALGTPAYENYPLRPYDAAALQRLVRLSFEIRRQQVTPSAIPSFMTQHPEWSTHPADGRPFIWNADTGEIAIHTVAKQPADRRFSVQVWRRSPAQPTRRSEAAKHFPSEALSSARPHTRRVVPA